MPTSHASTVLTAPADDVWARIRDFNDLAPWRSGDGTHDEQARWSGPLVSRVLQGGFDALEAHVA